MVRCGQIWSDVMLRDTLVSGFWGWEKMLSVRFLLPRAVQVVLFCLLVDTGRISCDFRCARIGSSAYFLVPAAFMAPSQKTCSKLNV